MNKKILIPILILVLIGVAITATIMMLDNQEEKIVENTIPTETEEEMPLFMTTMTHMEAGFNDDENEIMFWSHVDQLTYGMDLADEYDAIITVETEKPFATASIKWDYNIMAEVLERGHGVGTHCDIGGVDQGDITVEMFAKEFEENKELVDMLIGEENNHGCSGGGAPTDWVLAAALAGFEYLQGPVGMHLLSMDYEDRPGEIWTDEYIAEEGFHINAPEDLEDRIYLIKLKDATDLEHDEDGVIVLTNGALASLDGIEEGGGCYPDCELAMADVDVLVEIIREVDGYRDRTQVAKLNVYIPSNMFVEKNEVILRYFFEEMQKLQEEGIIQWASQWEVVETYLESN